MARLSKGDLERLLVFVAELNEGDGPEAFLAPVLDRLRELLPCDRLSFCELDHLRHEVVACHTSPASGGGSADEQPGSEFFDACWNSPLHVHRRRTNPSGPIKLSDVESRRVRAGRPHGAVEYYPHSDVKDTLWIDLDPSLVQSKRFLVDSCDRDFAERDRLIGSLLQPHLATAHRRAAKCRLLRAALAAVDRAILPVVLLTPEGGIALASASAHELLERHFGSGSRLPQAIDEWRRRRNGRQPLVLQPNGRRLVVETAGAADALVLHEEAPAGRVLTSRERDVILLVARGKANKEIARDLWVTSSTVRKHLEHVYEKLGVTSRTAALAKLGLTWAG